MWCCIVYVLGSTQYNIPGIIVLTHWHQLIEQVHVTLRLITDLFTELFYVLIWHIILAFSHRWQWCSSVDYTLECLSNALGQYYYPRWIFAAIKRHFFIFFPEIMKVSIDFPEPRSVRSNVLIFTPNENFKFQIQNHFSHKVGFGWPSKR
jgi:hypothetical protein